MANSDRPRGFRPYGELLSVGIYVAAGTIYPGDAVKQEAGASNTTQKRMRVEAGANAGALCGVALNYATVGQEVRVADSPLQKFVGQGDGSQYDENADLGTNAGLLATAGDSTYKISRHEIKTSDQNTTATLEFKVLGILPDAAGQNVFGEFVDLIVKINNHQLGSHTGTAGV